jgi:hypothetical protein
MDRDQALREQLVFHLRGKGAHIDFDAAVAGFPAELAGRRVPKLEHTAWGLVYHLRIAQADIVDFIRNPKYAELEYPSGYWPKEDGPADPKAWDETVAAFQHDLREMVALVSDPNNDLFARIPHGSGQTLLREAILVVDHNSYHIGQLVDIRMLLGVPVRDW